ncbi:MAG: hypothetical protein WBW37_10195, partial [Methyloceanibacter sp.]
CRPQANVFGIGDHCRPDSKREIDSDPNVPADQHSADQAPIIGHYNKRKQTHSSREKEPPTDTHDPQRLRQFILGDLFGTCHKQHSSQA